MAMDRKERKDKIINLIDSGVKIIAIDGRCASGKSTLSLDVKSERDINIIKMDDFFLPLSLRTPERFAMPGGNVHWERFLDEVVAGLRSGKDFSYRRFSCSKMDYDGIEVVEASKPIIIEGSYALHPSLPVYWERAFFLDVENEEQLSRLERRSPEKLEDFKNKWIPLEEKYFSFCAIPSKADEIL